MLSNEDIGLPVVRANNINEGVLDLENDVKYWYLKDPQGAKTSNYYISINDILINFINSEAKMGTAAFVEDEPKRPTIYTTNIMNLRINERADPYFIYMLTNTNHYKNYIKLITKPAVNQASFTTVDFKKFIFNIPRIEEQREISSFFRKLEKNIVCHQQELETLKQTKQGFLQKMFPKEGEMVPEVRFDGSSGDWKSKPLSEVFKDFIVPMRDKPKEFSGSIPWTRIEDIEGKYLSGSKSNQFVSEETIRNMNLKVIPKGSLIVSASATFGVVAIVRNDLITNQTFIGLVPNQGFDVEFLYSFFKSPLTQNKLKKESAGSTIFYISRKQFETLIGMIPPLEEQKKIGNFFKQLDRTIELQEKELEALKETKKAFLQKMFV